MRKMQGVMFLLMMLASLMQTAFAGRGSMVVLHTKRGLNQGVAITRQEGDDQLPLHKIHERLLRVNAKDYGNYEPSPTFSKPPYKLIPN